MQWLVTVRGCRVLRKSLRNQGRLDLDSSHQRRYEQLYHFRGKIMKALILIDDHFEELSLFLPKCRLEEEGVEVVLASPLMHTLTGQHGYAIEPEIAIHDLNVTDFSLLVIVDGPAVEKLRLREEAVDVARTFVQEGWPVAAIGHGLQLLISAGALDGKSVTCSPGIRDDVRAVGASYRDEAVISDGNLLTCRGCDDLAELNKAIMKLLKAQLA
jgi:protease I